MARNFHMFPLNVTTQVSIAYQRIPCNTLEPSIEIIHHFLRDHTQKGDITLDLLEPRTKLHIFSPNPLMRIILLTLADNYGSSLYKKLFELLDCQYCLKNVVFKL